MSGRRVIVHLVFEEVPEGAVDQLIGYLRARPVIVGPFTGDAHDIEVEP